ncbi:hypothetical protein C5688_05405 [Methylocystis sp. MitZ-2018]|nr:hypothetical protein C5688_05405 [Methylocystis sp. MitZ-2018]
MNSDRLQSPASRYVLQAGAVIPAALVSDIRSDLPGRYRTSDRPSMTPTGKFLLIPQAVATEIMSLV